MVNKYSILHEIDLPLRNTLLTNTSEGGYIYPGTTVQRLSPWRDGTGRIESRDRAGRILSVLRRPDESLKAVSDLAREMAVCEYHKGLGHHTSGCEFELRTPPHDHY